MKLEPPWCSARLQTALSLRVYLLGSVEFEAALAFQRRLLYRLVGERTSAALVLCEHPPLITVGREGSWAHIQCDPQQLCERRWQVRWVNRGGGCILHMPGQLAIYPILPLDRLELGLRAYVDGIHDVLCALLDDFGITGETRPQQVGVWKGGRPMACIGIAVHNWLTYYGAVLNVNPNLEPFRLVRCGGSEGGTMTSLERERRGPVRPGLVRERVIEHFVARFGFAQTHLFFDPPSLGRKAPSDALATRR